MIDSPSRCFNEYICALRLYEELAGDHDEYIALCKTSTYDLFELGLAYCVICSSSVEADYRLL